MSARQFQSHLYIVDNIAAAAARGWQVIQHQTPAATRAVFEQLGLL